jgi:hypothetical protein
MFDLDLDYLFTIYSKISRMDSESQVYFYKLINKYRVVETVTKINPSLSIFANSLHFLVSQAPCFKNSKISKRQTITISSSLLTALS